MPIADDEVECSIQDSSLGPGSRHFFEAMALPHLKQARSHALKLAGLVIVEGQTDSRMIWSLTFNYQGHLFLIDTNDHAGLSQFYVADPECSIDILLQVLDHFQKLSMLRFADKYLKPESKLPRYTFFREWWREAGCVLLVFACVLMVGWIKSIWFVDTIQFYFW